MLDNVGFNSSDSPIIGISYCKSGSYGFAPLLYIKLFIAIFVGLSHILRHLWNKTRRRTLMLILILIVLKHQWIIISKVVVISNYFKNDSYFNKRLVNVVKYMYVYLYRLMYKNFEFFGVRIFATLTLMYKIIHSYTPDDLYMVW